jgi:hypothetical protein
MLYPILSKDDVVVPALVCIFVRQDRVLWYWESERRYYQVQDDEILYSDSIYTYQAAEIVQAYQRLQDDLARLMAYYG